MPLLKDEVIIKLSNFNIKAKKLENFTLCKYKDQHADLVKQALKNFFKDDIIYYELFCFVVFVVLQIVVSTGHYSGYATPPKYGDYEAQRHWMEITIHLPIKVWYVNTTQNDLNYWGLDYPPLTAYHSWMLGKIANFFNKRWVALFSSRGIETIEHKLFMRLTVILTMCTVYATAIFTIFRQYTWRVKNPTNYVYLLFIALCYPGLIFVDNGHFQYNHISLGFFLWSIICFRYNKYYIGSIFFLFALNFKQMELYHALPIFIFLLSRSFVKKASFFNCITLSFFNVLKLGLIVLVGFIILWLPFFIDYTLIIQVLRRLFPIYRGIFEDKVANFWCCISVFYKIKDNFSNDFLALISACFVLLSIIPSLCILFKRSTNHNFNFCLTISSLSFYLFSFQVHEKSILIAVIPGLLLFYECPNAVHYFLSVSLFSLYPLCIKDQMSEILPLFITYHYFVRFVTLKLSGKKSFINWIGVLGFYVALLICFMLLFVQPPVKYPHLFELFNALFSFLYFILFLIYLNYQLFMSNFSFEKKTYKIKKS